MSDKRVRLWVNTLTDAYTHAHTRWHLHNNTHTHTAPTQPCNNWHLLQLAGCSEDGSQIIIARIHEGGVTHENGMLSEGDQVSVCM
jgi:hypothetical protein